MSFHTEIRLLSRAKGHAGEPLQAAGVAAKPAMYPTSWVLCRGVVRRAYPRHWGTRSPAKARRASD